MFPPDDERFADRVAAGRALGALVAEHLKPMSAQSAETSLVMALPRGGVPVGYEVASATGSELDLLITCRISLPWQPEFAIGAVAQDGPAVIDHDALASAGLSLEDIGPAVRRARVELARRQDRYRRGRPMPALAGRTVVLVDDGLTPCVVARAAARALRHAGAAHLVFAAPVCAAESADSLRPETDAVMHIHSPREFHALGMWYREFPPVGEHDVSAILDRAWEATSVR
jgi:predicted phosphoribosyltransferase